MMEFPSPGAFAAHLRRVQATMPAAETAGLKMGAELIRDEAQASLGHYQIANTGPFEAWAPLALATVEEREEQGYPPDDPLERSRTLHDNIEMSVGVRGARVGVPDRMVQLPYKRHEDNIGEIAEALEFGTQHIPPRSFLGLAAFRYGGAAAGLIGSVAAAALAGMSLPKRRPPGFSTPHG
jgi:hypothetical protein